MILSELKRILNNLPDSYGDIEVASNVDLSGFRETTCVIVDKEARFARDYSWIKKPILFLNESTQLMHGYTPEIYT